MKQKEAIINNLKSTLEEKEEELAKLKQTQHEKDSLIAELKEAKEILERKLKTAREEVNEQDDLLEEQKNQIEKSGGEPKYFKERIIESKTNFEQYTKADQEFNKGFSESVSNITFSKNLISYNVEFLKLFQTS